MNVVIVFVKNPQPGKVKTRLTSSLSPEEAAALYRAFIRDTLATVSALPDVETSVAYTPAEAKSTLQPLFDDCSFDWFPQTGDTLGTRLWHAFQRAFRRGARRVVTIGSDSPTLPSEIFDRAFSALGRTDVALGPATDGGYYLIGLTDHGAGIDGCRHLFDGISWSTEAVYAQTMKRIREQGMTCTSLPVWADVDHPEDLTALSDYIRQRRNEGDARVAVHTERMLNALRSGMEKVRSAEENEERGAAYGCAP